MSINYERTVKAALAETRGKFALAEALALDIPKQQGKDGVHQALCDAREAIIAAGGEPKAVGTLADYRQVALHFRCKHPKFKWVEGVSYTAHQEAYKAGMSVIDFKALGSSKRNVKSIRAWAKEQRNAEASETLEELRSESRKRIRDEGPPKKTVAEDFGDNLMEALNEFTVIVSMNEFEETHFPAIVAKDTERAEQVLKDIKRWVERLEEILAINPKVTDEAIERLLTEESA